ncbi:MAG: hypothetical protein CMO55_01900 [Verrucomicrobiales bacterium]|nr:hypothetical protein [Verrucomicrobiales bacterium]
MKQLSLLLAILLFAASPAFAGDVTYTATLSGIDCAGCKKTIAKSIGKIKGIKTIRIVEVSEGKHKMTIITDGENPISKSDAQNALKKAEHYQILSWSQS